MPAPAEPLSPVAAEAQVYALCTGTVLRLLRERQGLTQRGLGQRAGLSQRDLSRLETGAGRADAVRLSHLARALGLRAEELLGLVQDTWARAGRACDAGIQETLGPWYRVVERVTGEEGTRSLIRFAAAAALHPWPR